MAPRTTLAHVASVSGTICRTEYANRFSSSHSRVESPRILYFKELPGRPLPNLRQNISEPGRCFNLGFPYNSARLLFNNHLANRNFCLALRTCSPGWCPVS